MVSGKGDVGKHLKTLGFTYESLSDRVREEADSRGVERLRENLQDIGNDLRERYGLHVLAERTVEILGSNSGDIVIDGVRNPGEIEFLRRELDAKIFGIDAPVEKRLEWYLARAEERHEDGASVEEFMRANNRDFGIGESGSGQQVGRCLELADCIINNDSSKKKLFEEVEYYLILNGFSPEGARRAQKEIKWGI
jgi:dephospho-CoA kinase